MISPVRCRAEVARYGKWEEGMPRDRKVIWRHAKCEWVCVRETEILSVHQSKQRPFLSSYKNHKPPKACADILSFSATSAPPLPSILHITTLPSPLLLIFYCALPSPNCLLLSSDVFSPLLTSQVQICTFRQLYCKSAYWKTIITQFISFISHLSIFILATWCWGNHHLHSPHVARERHMVNKGSLPNLTLFCHCFWCDFRVKTENGALIHFIH